MSEIKDIDQQGEVMPLDVCIILKKLELGENCIEHDCPLYVEGACTIYIYSAVLDGLIKRFGGILLVIRNMSKEEKVRLLATFMKKIISTYQTGS